jgi:hypothetical protein
LFFNLLFRRPRDLAAGPGQRVALVQRLVSVSNQYPRQWLGCLRRTVSDEV